MNCPHCQEELPEDYLVNWCKYCGRDLLPGETSSDGPSKTNWPFFFAVLLAPAALSFVGIAMNLGVLVLLATFGGTLIAGKVCSGMVEAWRGQSTAVRWLLAAAMAVLSFLLCFGGCIAGGVITSR